MTKSRGILIKNPLDRFWKFVDKSNSLDGCWNWIGRKNHKGYGVMKIHSKSVQSHRFSYEIHVGKIPTGLLVCHHCDNPSCVNPKHLFLGTIQDNNLDRDTKGRKALGTRNGKSKLKDADVIEIKGLLASGTPDLHIAKKFNVWSTTIRQIRLGITWSHLS